MGETKQLTKEQQAALKAFDKAAASHQMVEPQLHMEQSLRETSQLQSQSIQQLASLGLFHLSRQEGNVLERQMLQQPRLSHEADMMEKSRKKKGDQERDAAARAARAGITYTAQQEALQNALPSNRAKEEETRPLSYYDVSAQTQSPFRALQQSEEADFAAIRSMLNLRDDLAVYLRRAPQELDAPDAAVILAQKQALFQKIDQAVKTYYTANGVDMATGKLLSASKAKKARSQLALAMENAQEALCNQEADLAEMRLNALRKDKAFQNQIKQATEADKRRMKEAGLPGALAVRGDSHEYERLCAIRQEITAHPERYRQRQKEINQLFAELSNCASTISSLDRQASVARQMLDGDESLSANALRGAYAEGGVFAMRREVVLQRSHCLESALRYLLTGQEPTQTDHVLFLKNRCGLETEAYAAMRAAPEMVRQEAANRSSAAQRAAAAAGQQAEAAGEQAERKRFQAERVRALASGSLSDQILACAYDEKEARRELADRQFRKEMHANRINSVLCDNLSLLTTPISNLDAPGDAQAMEACYRRAVEMQAENTMFRKLETALDDALNEYSDRQWIGTPVVMTDGTQMSIDEVTKLYNYLRKANARRVPLEPDLVNKAREAEASLTYQLRTMAEDEPEAVVNKKFAYSKTAEIVYTMPEKLSEDLEGRLQPFREELRLYQSSREEIEAFIRAQTVTFKAFMTPQERMAGFAAMDLVARKVKALSNRLFRFRNSPFYCNLTPEQQEQFPDFYNYFRGVEEFVSYNAKLIDGYSRPNDQAAQMDPGEVRLMGLDLEAFCQDYIRRISGAET